VGLDVCRYACSASLQPRLLPYLSLRVLSGLRVCPPSLHELRRRRLPPAAPSFCFVISPARCNLTGFAGRVPPELQFARRRRRVNEVNAGNSLLFYNTLSQRGVCICIHLYTHPSLTLFGIPFSLKHTRPPAAEMNSATGRHALNCSGARNSKRQVAGVKVRYVEFLGV
jgi:hypothetical protein